MSKRRSNARSRCFCALTGARVEDAMAHRRGCVVDAARNLAIHFLVEEERHQITRIARAMGRHWSSTKNSHLQGWRLREAEDGEEFFDWARAHWRKPLQSFAPGLNKRRAAFERVVAQAQIERRSRKVDFADLSRAITAAARADRMPRAKRGTSVPEIDDAPGLNPGEPETLRALKMAPALPKIAPATITSAPASGGAFFIEAAIETGLGATAEKAGRWLRAAALILDSMGFPATQRGVFKSANGWKAVLHVAG